MKSLGVLLVGLALTAARPARPRMHLRRDALPQFLNIKPIIKHQLREVVPDDRDCIELADAVGEFMHTGIDGMLLSMSMELPKGLSNLDFDMLTTLLTRVYGFDMINDVEARRNFYCEIAKSRSISDMKNRFDCLGINFNVFRLYYDYVIHNVRAVYPMMSMFISEQGIADIETLQSLGLFDLDPEGVTFLGDFQGQLMGEPMPTSAIPGAPDSTSAQQQCQTLQEIAHRHIAAMPSTVRADLQQWTGIHTEDQVNNLLCAIIDADDLEGVYDAYNGAGVIDQLYQNEYPKLAQHVIMTKQHLEYIIDTMEEGTSQNPGVGGPPPGMDGPPPGMDMDPQQLEYIKLALKFLQKVEDMGFFSLS